MYRWKGLRLLNRYFTNVFVKNYVGKLLDLSVFDIVHNRDQAFMGDNFTIFYSDKLGEYPYYGICCEPVYGGVPQNASLDRHLWKADNDLRTDIPDLVFHGLAVIDWEKWRPLWECNWDAKEIYWNGSRGGCVHTLPTHIFVQITTKRPGGLWGFYGFPCCYNYQYKKNETYTGECPSLEMKRNDKLVWLWNVSSTTLGRYIVNVTETAFLCSQTVCSSKGRCILGDPSGTAYLHLDPAEWSIVPRTKLPGSVSRGLSYVAHRRFRMVEGETSGFTASFRCQCFPDWEGEQCQKPVPVEPFT
uniref:Hyaluronidase n=1 Tax=Sinocyclocheilus grahami TaxID=75366 RepID=A0A672L7D3_SINGR